MYLLAVKKVQICSFTFWALLDECEISRPEIVSQSGPVCDPVSQNQSHGYICSNSQQYIVWVKMIDFMTKIIRILSKDHVP